VEPTTPCATNTPERTPAFIQSNFGGRGATGHGSIQEKSTGEASSGSNNQLSIPRGGSNSTQFKMAGQDHAIRLPEFRGEASEDPKNNLSIYENIWEENKITYEDTNLAHLALTLRDRALD
jgi:hypothetical protein